MEPYKLFLEVCHIRYCKEKGAKIICHRENLFFETFLSIDLLGPKKMINTLAQYMSKNIVDPHKLLFDVCHTRFWENKCAK